MAQCDRVDYEDVGCRLVGDRSNMGEVGFLRITQVRDESASRFDRCGAAVETVAFEAEDLELLEQRPARRFGRKDPRFRRGNGHLQPPDLGNTVGDGYI